MGLKRVLISSLRLISTAAQRMSMMSKTFPFCVDAASWAPVLRALVVEAGAPDTAAVSVMTAMVMYGWYAVGSK